MKLRDAQGTLLFVKRGLQWILGWVSYLFFFWFNRFSVCGLENLRGLPMSNVLFVSNHQTYYMDVIGTYYAIGEFFHESTYPVCPPRLGHMYYVSAKETMNLFGFLPRLFTYTGAVNVERTWKWKDQLVSRELDREGLERISRALADGWVITFPRGTTEAGAKGRIGTAKIVMEHRPIVVPVRIEGFDSAFHKTRPFVMLKKGIRLKVSIGKPMEIDYGAEAGEILERIMRSIGADGRCGGEPDCR